MSEPIKWLEVVLDYAKRFPDVKLSELIPNSYSYTTEMKDLKLGNASIDFKSLDQFYVLLNLDGIAVLGTTERYCEGQLDYRNNRSNWELVPDILLLRLLTEGKEDLI